MNYPQVINEILLKGFDGFLCLHLGISPDDVIDCVRDAKSDKDLNTKLKDLFPAKLNAHIWNRKVVQMGMSDMAFEKLQEVKSNLDAKDRSDLRSFADIIDFDEGRID